MHYGTVFYGKFREIGRVKMHFYNHFHGRIVEKLERISTRVLDGIFRPGNRNNTRVRKEKQLDESSRQVEKLNTARVIGN